MYFSVFRFCKTWSNHVHQRLRFIGQVGLFKITLEKWKIFFFCWIPSYENTFESCIRLVTQQRKILGCDHWYCYHLAKIYVVEFWTMRKLFIWFIEPVTQQGKILSVIIDTVIIQLKYTNHNHINKDYTSCHNYMNLATVLMLT